MTFESVLEEYLQRMKDREPFVMYRFGDGELMLADGEAVGPHTQASRVDRWEAPNRLTALGRDLRTVLATQEAWAHFGIPCPCCNEIGFQRLRDQSQTFPANLFINANYPRFKRFLEELSGSVAIVVNERAKQMPFPVAACLRVPDNGVEYYEHNRRALLSQARDFCRGLNRTLVLVSAGPLSEALIFAMWNTNPNNTYVDVGSALDELSYGEKTRSYMTEGSEYAMRSCPLPMSDDVFFSRFIQQSDASIKRGVLPSTWWSRGREYKWATNFVGPDLVVLDAACGISHPFKFWLSEACKEVVACDFDDRVLSEEAILIDIANDFGPDAAKDIRDSGVLDRIALAQADITSLPYADGSFDRVFCISVLEHMTGEARFQAISEFARVLKPGGFAVLTFDVPPLSPAELILLDERFEFAGGFDPELPSDALYTAMYGGLRCFRAVLMRKQS